MVKHTLFVFPLPSEKLRSANDLPTHLYVNELTVKGCSEQLAPFVHRGTTGGLRGEGVVKPYTFRVDPPPSVRSFPTAPISKNSCPRMILPRQLYGNELTAKGCSRRVLYHGVLFK